MTAGSYLQTLKLCMEICRWLRYKGIKESAFNKTARFRHGCLTSYHLDSAFVAPLCTSFPHPFLSAHARSTPFTKRATLGSRASVSRHTCLNHLSHLVIRIVCMLLQPHRRKTSAFDTLSLQRTPRMPHKFHRWNARK